jgi:hypothetical protein
MKNNILLFSSLILASLFIFGSCEKSGCTDELAVNYYKKVVTDDGSCSYSTTRVLGDYTYTYDSTLSQAIVYSLEKSLMKVNGTFDRNVSEFKMIVNWETRALTMPDSILPDSMTVTGLITDKDNFTIDVRFDSLDFDTSYQYVFTR